MPDPIFENSRLVALYDVLDGVRDDLVPYLAILDEFGARRVVDIGCGTGTFAVQLAARGVDVTAVDPAVASVRAAMAKPGAHRVRWVHGLVLHLAPLDADAATMTGNVAQAITDPEQWAATLRASHHLLRPGGHLIVETRRPSDRGWTRWNRADTYCRTSIPGEGLVESWVDLLDVDEPLVSFRWTFRFQRDDTVLTSDSTLRFRDLDEMTADLASAGYTIADTRDAPDRPGREDVYLAKKSS